MWSHVFWNTVYFWLGKTTARHTGILLPVLLPYHRSRHVILHQSAKFHPNRTAEKNDVMSIFKMADVR